MPYLNDIGYRPTDTSLDAAQAIEPNVQHLEAVALIALCDKGPMTADEVAAAVGEERLSIRPRITGLKHKGLIVDAGERRRNRSGRMAAVWRAKS